jgi:dipeptidyl aminopeptidase/acylaminoacyl peptidase
MNDKFKEIEVVASLDGSKEKNLLFFPENKKNVPLVVALHTWSADRYNQQGLLDLCQERGWALLLPEFRGPNLVDNSRAAQACGSKLARQDVIDAVECICLNYSVDTENIFLLGGSGGGHMALMMAGYQPELWCGVSAWCPITDLTKWYEYYGAGQGYAPHIASCCGGAPDSSKAVNLEYKERSPINYLNELMKAKLFIHHGRSDISVPYTHTLELALKLEALGHEQLFFEIFEGGHEIRADVAFSWFDSLYNVSKQQKLTG